MTIPSKVKIKFVEVGDKIKIINMKDEPHYAGKTGVITEISKDPWGDTFFRGTWGGCSVYPSQDTYEIIKKTRHL